MIEQLSEDAVFRVAYGIESPELRDEYLRQISLGDPALYHRVTALLEARREEPDFLESPAAGVGVTVDFEPIAECPGTQIGPYKLLEEIGEGGMGVVYMALQQEPVRRKVALKIIKPGMDTREVIARFEAEEQALAMMDHPNIAKVLDAGTTESGRPYFAMEAVNGMPITEYCDSNNLPTRRRLELFVLLCRAVQHAHQKGIIHRDLKPSNILVTLHDGVPVPKIIDFGIAKATNQELTTKTLATGLGHMVGTPLYMSPEQAERSGLDIDTRSDIYSLGVLLYELLTGTTPFDQQQLEGASLDDIRRLIREQDPPRPSTRISTLNKAATTASEHRRTDPVELSNSLRHELDWIVMKALEKDRTRRYETANDLARDIQRYLNDEPVEACPPSTAYRLKKFVRRNRSAVLVSTTVGLVVILAACIATAQAIRASRVERQQAAWNLRVNQGISQALTEATRLRSQVSSGAIDERQSLAKVREQVQRAVALVDSGAAAPDLRRSVEQLSTELHQKQQDLKLLADFERAWTAQGAIDASCSVFTRARAGPILKEALQDYGMAIGKDDPTDVAARIRQRPEMVRNELLTALQVLADLCPPIVGLELREADGATVIQSITPHGPADRDGHLCVGDRLVGIGQGSDGPIEEVRNMKLPDVRTRLRGESGTIVRLQIKAVDQKGVRTFTLQRDATQAWLRTVVRAAESDSWRLALLDASCLEVPQERRGAWEHFAETVDIDRQPVLALTDLAAKLQIAGSHASAIALLKRAHDKYPGDFWVNTQLALFLQLARPPQPLEAVRYGTVAVALRPDNAGVRLNCGMALKELGRYEEAIWQFREAIRTRPDYAQAYNMLGSALDDQGKYEEAVVAYRKALRLLPTLSEAHVNLGVTLSNQGKTDEALTEYREAVRLMPNNAMVHNNLGGLYADNGNISEAIKQLRRALELDDNLAMAHHNLGEVLSRQETWDEAIVHYRKAIELEPRYPKTYNLLGIALDETGHLDEALTAWTKAIEIDPEFSDARHNLAAAYYNMGNDHSGRGEIDEAIANWRTSIGFQPDFAEVYNNLAYNLYFKGQREEAITLYRKAVEIQPDYAAAYNDLGNALKGTGQLDQAIAAYRKAVEIQPDDALNLQNLARALDEGGCQAEASDVCGKAIDAWRKTIEQQPDQAAAYNELAWLLATATDTRRRNPAEAVELATKAVELDPDTGAVHNTLGVAYCRAGKWREATESLQKSMALTHGGDANDWFFLALAHWQLGDQQQARTWFEKAVVWTKEHRPRDRELENYWTEAAELLGETPPEGETENRKEIPDHESGMNEQ